MLQEIPFRQICNSQLDVGSVVCTIVSVIPFAGNAWLPFLCDFTPASRRRLGVKPCIASLNV